MRLDPYDYTRGGGTPGKELALTALINGNPVDFALDTGLRPRY